MITTHEYALSCQRAARTTAYGRTLRLLGLFLCATALSAALSTPLHAQVPQLINFQAQLADDGTLPSPTTILFSIYDAASGGTQLWTEQHTVTHTNGIFNVLLGSATPFPAALFTADGERYLDMLVGGEFLYERFRLSSVAYALRAEAADKTGPAGITFPDGTVQTTAATSSGGGGDNGWTISGSNLFSSVSGNVGIGTANPGTKLDVRGDISMLDSNRLVFGVNGIGGWGEWMQNGVGDGLDYGIAFYTNSQERMRINTGTGYVGIGTTAPTERLQVGDFDQGDLYLAIKSVGGNVARNGIKFRNFNDDYGWTIENDERLVNDGLNFLSHFDDPTGVSRLFLGKFGNVGIGTTSPTGKVHMAGSAAFNAPVLNIETTNDTWYNIQLKRGGDPASDYFIGRAPSSLLGGRALALHIPSASAEYGGEGAQPKLSFVSTGVNELGFVEAETGNWYMKGNVGIGTTAPVHPLEMASGAHVTTGGVWTNASSRDYKENIHDLTTEEAMAALSGLVPVQYNYKVDQEEGYLGFIAEDVPDLVATGDRKGLSPMDIVAVLTKVVQQQQQQIAALEARLNR